MRSISDFVYLQPLLFSLIANWASNMLLVILSELLGCFFLECNAKMLKN